MEIPQRLTGPGDVAMQADEGVLNYFFCLRPIERDRRGQADQSCPVFAVELVDGEIHRLLSAHQHARHCVHSKLTPNRTEPFEVVFMRMIGHL